MATTTLQHCTIIVHELLHRVRWLRSSHLIPLDEFSKLVWSIRVCLEPSLASFLFREASGDEISLICDPILVVIEARSEPLRNDTATNGPQKRGPASVEGQCRYEEIQ